MSTARRWLTGPAVALLTCFALAQPALAQDTIEQDDEIDAALADASPGDPTVGDGDRPEIGEDQLAVFALRRGFYFSSDLGIFMTFAGVNGFSNVEPFMALKAGFDIGDYVSVQAVFSGGYASGNPISENDRPGNGGFDIANYSLFNMGIEIVGAIRPTERFAIEPKIGGGLTRLSPAPTDPGDINVTVSPFVPHAAFGVDLKYLTLLTDFTAGISLTGYAVIVGSTVVPAGAAAFVVRYTF
ncbi:MAG: adventurous gliding motility protein CglE [Myxococcota bacterium]